MPRTKKAAAPEVEPEVDDLEDLEEDIPETEAAAPVKRTRKAKAKKEKVVPAGKTTKEVAAELGVTPVKLRRILRTDDFANDHEYTRYFLDDETIERLKAAIAAGVGERKRGRPKKKAEVEAAEITEELDELDEETDEGEDLDFEDEDEEEEEE